jgi:hypothetical protein
MASIIHQLFIFTQLTFFLYLGKTSITMLFYVAL